MKKIFVFVVLICLLPSKIIFAENYDVDLITEEQQIHQKAWEEAVIKAADHEEYKNAIYMSRTLMVKHPEIYLQADQLFETIMNKPSTKALYLDDTQELFEKQKRQTKILRSKGSSLKWRDIDIKKYKTVTYKDMYYVENTLSITDPFFENKKQSYVHSILPFLDMRIYSIPFAIESSDMEMVPITKAQVLYYQLLEKGKDPYLLVTAKGQAYVAEQNTLYDYEGKTVKSPSNDIMLIMNNNYVWYPLMERDDTEEDRQLEKLVVKYAQPNYIPEVSEFEKSIIDGLKKVTELSEDRTETILAAGHYHLRSMDLYPDLYKKVYPDLYGQHEDELTELLIMKGFYRSKLANKLSPIAAQLASYARSYADLPLKDLTIYLKRDMLAAIATVSKPNKEQAGLDLWIHPEHFFPTIDDTYISKASYCAIATSNAMAVLELANIKDLKVYGTAMDHGDRTGGHSFTVAFRNNENSVFENIGMWGNDTNGLTCNDTILFSGFLIGDKWFNVYNEARPHSDVYYATINKEEVIQILKELSQKSNGHMKMSYHYLYKEGHAKGMSIEEYIQSLEAKTLILE